MYRQSEENLLNSNNLSTCPDNMVNFGPLTAEIGSGVWGTVQISTGFASWQRYCTASSSGRQPNFWALNRGRHLCSAGRPSGWALAHILVWGVIQQSVHETKIHDIDDLRKLLMQTPFWLWPEHHQCWRDHLRSCVHAGGGHFEHMLWPGYSFIWFIRTFYETINVIWCK